MSEIEAVNGLAVCAGGAVCDRIGGAGMAELTRLAIAFALGMILAAILVVLYYRERRREARLKHLEKQVEQLKANPKRATEDRILDALAVLADTEVEAQTLLLRMDQARRILFDAKSKRPHADQPAGMRPSA